MGPFAAIYAVAADHAVTFLPVDEQELTATHLYSATLATSVSSRPGLATFRQVAWRAQCMRFPAQRNMTERYDIAAPSP
jgi:hypothetical protein